MTTLSMPIHNASSHRWPCPAPFPSSPLVPSSSLSRLLLLVLPSLPLPPTPSSSLPLSLPSLPSAPPALQFSRGLQLSRLHIRWKSPWFHLDSLPRLLPGSSLHQFHHGLLSWLRFGSCLAPNSTSSAVGLPPGPYLGCSVAPPSTLPHVPP